MSVFGVFKLFRSYLMLSTVFSCFQLFSSVFAVFCLFQPCSAVVISTVV